MRYPIAIAAAALVSLAAVGPTIATFGRDKAIEPYTRNLSETLGTNYFEQTSPQIIQCSHSVFGSKKIFFESKQTKFKLYDSSGLLLSQTFVDCGWIFETKDGHTRITKVFWNKSYYWLSPRSFEFSGKYFFDPIRSQLHFTGDVKRPSGWFTFLLILELIVLFGISLPIFAALTPEYETKNFPQRLTRP